MEIALSTELKRIVSIEEVKRDYRLQSATFSCVGVDVDGVTCGAPVVPCALSSRKVRPYFRAVGDGHVPGCDEGTLCMARLHHPGKVDVPRGYQAAHLTTEDIPLSLHSRSGSRENTTGSSVHVDGNRTTRPRNPGGSTQTQADSRRRGSSLGTLLRWLQEGKIQAGQTVSIGGWRDGIPIVAGKDMACRPSDELVVVFGRVGSVKSRSKSGSRFINFAVNLSERPPGIHAREESLGSLRLSEEEIEGLATEGYDIVAVGYIRLHDGGGGAHLEMHRARLNAIAVRRARD